MRSPHDLRFNQNGKQYIRADGQSYGSKKNKYDSKKKQISSPHALKLAYPPQFVGQIRSLRSLQLKILGKVCRLARTGSPISHVAVKKNKCGSKKNKCGSKKNKCKKLIASCRMTTRRSKLQRMVAPCKRPNATKVATKRYTGGDQTLHR